MALSVVKHSLYRTLQARQTVLSIPKECAFDAHSSHGNFSPVLSCAAAIRLTLYVPGMLDEAEAGAAGGRLVCNRQPQAARCHIAKFSKLQVLKQLKQCSWLNKLTSNEF